ncbi:MAG: hypothetical protein IPK59_22415 [Rhodospirillaceae bacterium]|nr:hypothetical protein [Rhodospirillaceae bacterium]
MECGCCGSQYTVCDRVYIACGAQRSGKSCDNGRRANLDHLEEQVLAGLRHHLTQPDAIDAFDKEYRAAKKMMREARGRTLKNSDKKIRELQSKIDRIVDAIANGTDTPAMRKAVVEHESMLAELRDQADAAREEPDVELHSNLAELYRARLDGIQVALNDPSCRHDATQLIRHLIDRIILRPTDEERGLEAEVVGLMAGLADIAGKESYFGSTNNARAPERTVSLASPTGVEPVSSP